MGSKILGIGTNVDPHLISVRNAALRNGADFRIWDPLEQLDIIIDSSGNINACGWQFDSDKPLIFWRDKRHVISSLFEDEKQYRYWMDQWDTVYRVIDSLIPAYQQANPRSYTYNAGCKIIGQRIAQAARLRTADQIVTNKPDAIPSPWNDLAHKRLGSAMPSSSSSLWTQRFTREMVNKNKDSFKQTPNLIQRYIEKRYEIRLAACDEVAIAVRIDSQETVLGKTDWRRVPPNEAVYADYNAQNLPIDQVHEFMKLSGISFGQFDFIVEPDGQYLFLECNPSGQWMFIPQFETAFTEALAQSLYHRAHERHHGTKPSTRPSAAGR